MSNYQSQRELKTTWPTISKWRERWEEGYDRIIAFKRKEITMLRDQLNTHKSEGLVRYIAEQIGYEGDLGTIGYKGILKSDLSSMLYR